MKMIPQIWTQHIWILGIHEFPSFLVIGKSASALIEAGVSSLVPKILSDIEAAKPSAPLKYLIATHAHADHVCGLIKLKHIHPDLFLCGSEQTGRILGKADIMKNFSEEDVAYNKYLSANGVLSITEKRLPAEPIALDLILKDHQVMDLGDVYIEIIDVPGHAPGGTAFLIMPDNVALISDSAGYANTADDILPLFFHHFQNSVESLKKLKSLRPEYLALGHNIFIDGEKSAQRFFERAISDMQKMKTGILEKLGNNSSTDTIESDLADKMRRYGMFQSFSRETLIRFSQLLIRRAMES